MVTEPQTESGREEVSLSPVPGACLGDPSIQVCEYDEASYPHSFVSTVLQTFSTEIRLLLKYVKPAMLVSTNAHSRQWNFPSYSLTTNREM